MLEYEDTSLIQVTQQVTSKGGQRAGPQVSLKMTKSHVALGNLTVNVFDYTANMQSAFQSD